MTPGFPQNLRSIRMQRGYSQKQLASLAKLDPSSVCNFERGHRIPALRSISKLANALSVTIDCLMGTAINHKNGTSQLINQIIQNLKVIPQENQEIVAQLTNTMSLQANKEKTQ